MKHIYRITKEGIPAQGYSERGLSAFGDWLFQMGRMMYLNWQAEKRYEKSLEQ